MPIFLGDKVQVSIIGRCYSQRIIFTHTYKASQAGAEGQTPAQAMTSLIGALDTGGAKDIMTPYLDCLQGDYTSLFIRAQIIRPVRLAYVQLVSVHPGFGGDGTVANDSACVTLRSLDSGRGKFCNKHIGPIPDGVSVAGTLDVPFTLKMNALGAALVEQVQPVALGVIWQPVVLTRSTGNSVDLVNWAVGVFVRNAYPRASTDRFEDGESATRTCMNEKPPRANHTHGGGGTS